MGFASNPKNITLCLSALETAISDLGGKVERGAALEAAAKVYGNIKSRLALSRVLLR